MKKFIKESIGFFVLLSIVFGILWLYAYSKRGDAYIMARIDKHEMIANTSSPKVVFIGGSNLAFGIDCSQIEDSLGMDCLNMGLKAGQGLRFIMDDFTPEILSMKKEDGNVIVLMPEFRHFFGDMADGEGETLGEVIMYDPIALNKMCYPQKLKAIKGLPKQITGSLMETILKSNSGFKYLRSNIDEEGDEIGHLKMAYDPARSEKPRKDYITESFNEDFFSYFQEKVAKWGEHATIVILPESVYKGFVDDNLEKMSYLQNKLAEANLAYAADLYAFSYPYDKIFLAPDHISREVLVENSGKVATALAKQLRLREDN